MAVRITRLVVGVVCLVVFVRDPVAANVARLFDPQNYRVRATTLRETTFDNNVLRIETGLETTECVVFPYDVDAYATTECPFSNARRTLPKRGDIVYLVQSSDRLYSHYLVSNYLSNGNVTLVVVEYFEKERCVIWSFESNCDDPLAQIRCLDTIEMARVSMAYSSEWIESSSPSSSSPWLLQREEPMQETPQQEDDLAVATFRILVYIAIGSTLTLIALLLLCAVFIYRTFCRRRKSPNVVSAERKEKKDDGRNDEAERPSKAYRDMIANINWERTPFDEEAEECARLLASQQRQKQWYANTDARTSSSISHDHDYKVPRSMSRAIRRFEPPTCRPPPIPRNCNDHDDDNDDYVQPSSLGIRGRLEGPYGMTDLQDHTGLYEEISTGSPSSPTVEITKLYPQPPPTPSASSTASSTTRMLGPPVPAKPASMARPMPSSSSTSLINHAPRPQATASSAFCTRMLETSSGGGDNGTDGHTSRSQLVMSSFCKRMVEMSNSSSSGDNNGANDQALRSRVTTPSSPFFKRTVETSSSDNNGTDDQAARPRDTMSSSPFFKRTVETSSSDNNGANDQALRSQATTSSSPFCARVVETSSDNAPDDRDHDDANTRERLLPHATQSEDKSDPRSRLAAIIVGR